MATMNIFDNDAFGMIELTDAFEESEFLPQYLEQFFEFRGVTTEKVAIEKKEKGLSLIPTSDRGSPIDEATGKKRNIRDFRTARIAKGDTVNATEIAGVRAFGKETEFQQVQSVVAERVMNLDDDLELTLENMRLGAIQGKVYDADGTSLIYDWYAEWGVTEPTEIDFDLDNATPAKGALMKKCTAMVRAILKESKGATTPNTKVIGLVGSDFWDELVSHEEVEKTYLNWSAAQDLRGDLQSPFGEFKFGGITWTEYRGTDDDTKVAVGAAKARFFPVGVKGNLVHAASPADEFMDFVNTKGKRKYTLLEQDPKTNKSWVRPEIYAYPLFYCARPLTLRSGRMT